MSRRLQVLLDEAEYEELQEAARRRRMTLAEWVRQGLRQARAGEPSRPIEEKLTVLQRAVSHDFPTGDIDQILAEIDRGRSAGLPR